MINILIPISNDSSFFPAENFFYPKVLCEIHGKMMIEIVIESLRKLQGSTRFIFVISKADADRYHLDRVLGLLAQNQCEIIKVDGKTQGAACSCLLAIDHINNDSELVISNCDQLIDADLQGIIQRFQARKLDAGVVIFESVHPKWSFVRLDGAGIVCEAAEKRPISRNAIAGLYYFQQGKNFVSGAFRSIEKDVRVEEAFYIAPILNELILQNKIVGTERIQASQYHSFYSPQKIKEFEHIYPLKRS